MFTENRQPSDGRRWLRFATAAAGAGCALAVLPSAALASSTAVPANNNIRQATVLTPVESTSNNASNTTDATAETGEPSPFPGVAPSHSVWYKWRAPSTCLHGTATIDTAGSNFDTVLAVYAPATSPYSPDFATLPRALVFNNDAPGVVNGYSQTVAFPVNNPRLYYIDVEGYTPSETGDVTVNVACTES